MGVLNLGMSIMGIDQNIQKVVKGMVLLAAVIFDLRLCLDIDHILCFLLFYLFLRLFFRLFFLRMKLLNLLKNLFQVKSRKKDLRFVGYAVS